MENDVSVTEGGGVGQGNKNCYRRAVLWCKRIDHLFRSKNKDKIKGSVKPVVRRLR